MALKRARLFLFMLLLLTACADTSGSPTSGVQLPSPSPGSPTEAAESGDEATAVPSPTPEPASTTPTVPAAEATATLPPIRATQQALADAVRVPTRAATGEAIAPDNFVALADQACRIVQENYVRDDFNGIDWPATCARYRQRAAGIDNQEAFWDMMSEFIGELGDEHSRFVAPGQFASEFRLPTEGAGRAWPGFTVWPAREDERLLVWDVCAVGPAASAGLRRGDVILAIDGQAIDGDPEEVGINQLLYAPEKNEVTLTVQQGPSVEPREMTIAYGGASGCDGWRYGTLSESPHIGYIRIPDFSGNAHTNILEAIALLEEEAPLEGLVLDVRHNPGGNSDQSIAIFTMGTFGLTGPLREDASQSIYRIRGPVRWNETTPVALLIDGASHSAAEYFATAMKQSGRATLVGMPTAGNTEGINSFNLADGSLIRLAWTTLQLPDGRTLEGVGAQPEVTVPLGEWGLRQEPDVQLQAAYDEVARP